MSVAPLCITISYEIKIKDGKVECGDSTFLPAGRGSDTHQSGQ